MNRGNSPAAPAVRDAKEADIPAITEIYAGHVRHGLASFEEVPPSAAEMAARRERIVARGLPYLVLERDGAVLGYACAAPYRDRSAYRFTVEDSVYVAEGARRSGIGRALLAPLIDRCADAGYRQMVAVIGDSENVASIGLHASLGFRVAGTLPSVGFKFGRWVDAVTMVRSLGEGDLSLPGDAAIPPR
jgi:phosphinothricin acetyltransferase